MNIKAYLTAFHSEDDKGQVKVRPIRVPQTILAGLDSEDTNALLNEAFRYGQNDFQPVEGCYSLSVGDVVELDPARRYRVASFGFKPLAPSDDPVALIGWDAQQAGRG